MRVVADNQLAGADVAVVKHHLVTDAHLRVAKVRNAQPPGVAFRVECGLRDLQPDGRLDVFIEHEDPISSEYQRRAIAETELAVDRPDLVVHDYEKAIELRVNHIPRSDGSAGEVLP